MTLPLLSGIRAWVFDAYGTLFDVGSAIQPYRARLGAAAEAISAVWRQKQLEYTWLRSLMGRHADFWQVTADALDFACTLHGINDEPLRRQLLDAYLTLACYPEVTGVLKRLKAGGMPCAILSNGSPEMLRAGVENSGIGDLLDAVYSVESVGIFKPHPRVYQLAVDGLGLPANQIAFMSSNAWDVAGAAAFGFQVVWVNRFNQPWEKLPVQPAVTVSDLGGLLGL